MRDIVIPSGGPEGPVVEGAHRAKIAVVDFGGGNLGSLVSALERRGADFVVTASPHEVIAADAAILPGDGAFGATMRALCESKLEYAVRMTITQRKPFLGICVGMQLLYRRSNEHGWHSGFGYFRERVKRFESAPRVPHMGWNKLKVTGDHPFVRGLGDDAYAYFLHSYRAPVNADTVATTEHGEEFAAIVARDNVMATQFHPEKSSVTGARLLDNFIAICDGRTP